MIFLREDYGAKKKSVQLWTSQGIGDEAHTGDSRWPPICSRPFGASKFRVAAYLRYSMMWLQSTIISGTNREAKALGSHLCDCETDISLKYNNRNE